MWNRAFSGEFTGAVNQTSRHAPVDDIVAAGRGWEILGAHDVDWVLEAVCGQLVHEYLPGA